MKTEIKSLQEDKDATFDALVEKIKESGNLSKLAELIAKETGLVAKKSKK